MDQRNAGEQISAMTQQESEGLIRDTDNRIRTARRVLLAQVPCDIGFVFRPAEIGLVEKLGIGDHRPLGCIRQRSTQAAIDVDVARHESIVRIKDEHGVRLRREHALGSEQPCDHGIEDGIRDCSSQFAMCGGDQRRHDRRPQPDFGVRPASTQRRCCAQQVRCIPRSCSVRPEPQDGPTQDCAASRDLRSATPAGGSPHRARSSQPWPKRTGRPRRQMRAPSQRMRRAR